METGKTGKYFKYAIGEIVLVVIGILIALQINTWSQNSKQNKLELDALINLKQDFDYNLKGLKITDSINLRNIESCLLILNNTGKNTTGNFPLDKYLSHAAGSPDYSPKNGFLNDLINSGNLGLLKNNHLRNRLSFWLAKLDELTLREQASEDFDRDLIRYIFKHGNWLNVDELTNNDGNLQLKFPKSGFDVDNNQMLKSLEFENRVENQATFFCDS